MDEWLRSSSFESGYPCEARTRTRISPPRLKRKLHELDQILRAINWKPGRKAGAAFVSPCGLNAENVSDPS